MSSPLLRLEEKVRTWCFAHWRGLTVAAFGLIGAITSWQWSRGVELGFVLKYVAPIAITFLAANWYLALVDLGLAVAYALPFWIWPQRTSSMIVRQAVVFGSRQFQYIDSILPCVMLVMVLPFDEWWPAPIVLPAFLLSISAIILLAPTAWERIADLVPRKNAAITDLHWRRRPIQIAIGLVAGLLLLLSSPSQAGELSRVFVLVWSAGVLRIVRWVLDDRDGHDEAHADFRAREILWAHRLDWVGGTGAAAMIALHLAHPFQAMRHDRDLECRQLLRNSCNDQTAAHDPGLELFIVSDSQFHELRGQRIGGSLDFVDAVVPVAVRPVELDLLGGSTLAHFADVFAEMKTTHPRLAGWVHLGDFGDLGCKDELVRFQKSYRDLFGASDLVALVPGNHDSSFVGNFAWHPDWDRVCRVGNGSERLTKSISDRMLADMMPDDPRRRHELVTHKVADKTFLTTVAALGDVNGVTIIGAFLDSSDYVGWTDLGAAGVQGAISRRQIRTLSNDIDALANGKKTRVILFMHHPFASLDASSQMLVGDLVDRYDVAGIVTAHTHLAAFRRNTVGKKNIDEFIVGSTIDPPQEAALLEVQPDGKLALRTIPVVTRRGQACAKRIESAASISAQDCRMLIRSLDEVTECKPLFLDHRLKRWVGGKAHPSTPREMRDQQEERVERLFGCACRGGRCNPKTLDDPALFEMVDALIARKDSRRELVCLAWAASITQGRKSELWDLNRALDDGYDGAAAFSALDLPDPAQRCIDNN